jgi:hypothetical protein
LSIEVPSWLPFKFPFAIQVNSTTRTVARLDIPCAGAYDFRIPIEQGGELFLRAPQWFVPAELGILSETRAICYKVADVEVIH